MIITSGLEKPLAKRSDLHLVRKIWHMSTGSIGLLIFYNTGEDTAFWGKMMLGLAFIIFLLEWMRMKFTQVNAIILKLMGPLMRQQEKTAMSGMPFYALGVGLSLILFHPSIAILSIMFLVYSDPISSFIGIIFGKDKIMPNKSLQGAIAGFFTCYFITLWYGIYFNISLNVGHFNDMNIVWFSVIAGVIGSLSELLSAFNIDDNLTIPVVSGLGLSILNYAMKVFI